MDTYRIYTYDFFNLFFSDYAAGEAANGFVISNQRAEWL